MVSPLRVLWGLIFSLCSLTAWAQAPTIGSFSPTSGPGGTTVTITGTNLTNIRSVVLRGIPCNITAISATQASFKVPAQASTGRFRLTTTGGNVLSGSDFTVTRASASLTYVLRTGTFNSISVGTFSTPAFCDLDHDGLIDLLVGREVDGLVSHYEQSSANSTSFTLRSNNLSGLTGHYNSIVSVTDIDGDGLLEMVVGAGAGNFKHYEQTAMNSTSFTQLSNDFNNIFSTGGTTYQLPHFTDIDGDGLLDLLVGDEFLSRWEQTAANGGTFTQLNNQNFASTADAGNGGSAICVVDLDGDNLLDILIGRSNGQIFHYEQNSANGTAFTQVSTAFSGLNMSGYPTPAITDLDGDGLLDMLAGGFDGNVRHYEQVGTPTITSFTPTSGVIGTSVTVTGTNLDGATAARVNGTAGTIVGTPTSTSLTFTVGAGSTTGTVSVVTPGGTATGATFTVTAPAPTITSFTPTSGPTGTSVTITGTNLNGATAARVNGTNGTIVGTPTSTSLTFTVGAGSTTGAVTVVTPGGTATGSNFTVIQPPTITSFTPTSGPTGTSVTITGTNLTGATAARVNGTAGTIVGTPTATSLTFMVGAGSTTGAVSVVTPGGTATGATFTVTAPAPTITSFTPTSGPVGTSVTVTGTNLDGATAARVNGTAGTIVGTPTATSLTFTVGAGSTTGAVSVTTPGGTATGTTFTIVQPPTITSFTPNNGPAGTSVTITGTNLTGATAARVNGTAGTITANTATSLTFTVGAGSSTGAVSVTTPGGTATGSTFTVPASAPTITSFGPNTGPVGTSVTITGTDLATTTSVRVNGVTGAIVGTPTATSLTFIVPGTATTGLISLTTPLGTATSATNFTVTSAGVQCSGATPLATSYVSNNSNKGEMFDIIATNTVTISCFDVNLILGSNGNYEIYYKMGSYVGSESNAAAWTLLGSNPNVPCLGFDVPSPMLIPINVTIPAGQTAAFYITATDISNTTGIRYTNNSGITILATSPDLSIRSGIGKAYPFGANYVNRSFNGTVRYFVGAPPTITSFTPTSGPIGTSVTVTGTNLTGANAVTVNGTAGTIVGTPTSTSLTFTVGAGSTTGAVSVTTPGGIATGSNFTVIQPPTITSFTPTSGLVGTSVTVTGTNLNGATAVRVNGTAGTIVGTPTATSLTFTVGAGSTTGAVSVTTPGGTATGSTFTVTTPAPTIVSFTPTSGPVGTSVTITGTNLAGATAARVNGTAGTIVGTPTASTVTFTVGAGSTTGAVSVVTPGGTATGSTFTVAPAPTITSFTPTSGPVGTSVTITGTNLAGATAARVNGTTGTIVGTPTATSLTFTVGAGSTTGAVSVTTPGGTATGSTFTVTIPVPTITSFTPSNGAVGSFVTLTGTNLLGATSVAVGGTVGSIVTNTATSLTFTVGAGSTTGAVSVTTPGGTATGGTFTVTTTGPGITSFTPSSGPVGTSVTITGTNLTGATSVTINGTPGTITANTATSLTFTVGAGSSTGLLSVTTPGGTVTTSAFTVTGVGGQCSAATPLSTPFDSNNGGRGIMFNVVATNDLTISCLDATIYATSGAYEVYYRVGGFAGFTSNAAAWTLVGSSTNLTGNGAANLPTAIPIPINLFVPAGTTVGIYLTGIGGGACSTPAGPASPRTTCWLPTVTCRSSGELAY